MLNEAKRSGGPAYIARDVSRGFHYYATTAPVAGRRTPRTFPAAKPIPAVFAMDGPVRLLRVQDDNPEESLDDGEEGWFGDYYDDYGGEDYDAVMGLPMQAIPVAGQVITIAGVVATVAGLTFNC